MAGDVWLDSDDTENFPALLKWSGTAWVAVDGTDQVTADGVIFADFRQSSAGSVRCRCSSGIIQVSKWYIGMEQTCISW